MTAQCVYVSFADTLCLLVNHAYLYRPLNVRWSVALSLIYYLYTCAWHKVKVMSVAHPSKLSGWWKPCFVFIGLLVPTLGAALLANYHRSCAVKFELFSLSSGRVRESVARTTHYLIRLTEIVLRLHVTMSAP